MSEKLLNTAEVARYLRISEENIRKLVERGEIPAYRLGGTILRFKKDQIDQIKARGLLQLDSLKEEPAAAMASSRSERFKDFLYFNDFYIVSVIVIIILLIIIFFY